MCTLHDVTAAFAGYDLHLNVYGAFAAHLLYRARFSWRECRFDDAREQAGHGLMYILLGLL